ncbi:PstS family phosphate ABC transporter substrate-binding protein [Neokomagataea anthophila]|uniref:PBP domain-containing protein n=1 Tax=Neokomagataea anthophila TaxID=2826925 RepID=A0ABS5E529_9PROT|nr:hypothetical protein [Neokomagataea anthophila]MBR0558916.1 hypothetical protein [Neokomagataea anthophila]
MKKHLFSLLSTLACTSLVHAATTENEPPIPPLVAHYLDPQGHLIIGGGPESEDIAHEFNLSSRIVGPAGSIPLLTHGIIAAAILPRVLTDGERAAMKRYTGGDPLILPILQGLYICVRRNSSNAIDERLFPLLRALFSENDHTKTKNIFLYLKNISNNELDSINKNIKNEKYELTPTENDTKINTINIIGSDTIDKLLPELEYGYKAHNPTLNFSNDLRGSSLAIPALIAGTSAIAPMGREAWQEDLNAFQQAKGYAPTRIRIAYASFGPRPDGKTPPAVYINQKNPIKGAAWSQIQRIFSASSPQPEAPQWSSLGLTQEDWAHAPIHIYGMNPDSSFALAMQQSKLKGLPFSSFYRAMPTGKAVLDAVARDPLGIGYSTWMDAGKAPPMVKLLPLSYNVTGPFVLPDGVSDRSKWPISYFFNIYIDCAPGKHIPQPIKKFLLYLTSEEGQKIILKHRYEENGYLPLQKQELLKERNKINSL